MGHLMPGEYRPHSTGHSIGCFQVATSASRDLGILAAASDSCRWRADLCRMVTGALNMSGPGAGGKYEEVPVSAKLPAVVGARRNRPEEWLSAQLCAGLQRWYGECGTLVRSGAAVPNTLSGGRREGAGADLSWAGARTPLTVGGRLRPPGERVLALTCVCHPRSGSVLSVVTNVTLDPPIFLFSLLMNLLP